MKTFDYNIYHLLNAKEGRTLRLNLLLAKETYEKRENYHWTYWYWTYEENARACFSTIKNCGKIGYDEYKELLEQLYFLMRLYKGKRGPSLGRKDVPTVKGGDAE